MNHIDKLIFCNGSLTFVFYRHKTVFVALKDDKINKYNNLVI